MSIFSKLRSFFRSFFGLEETEDDIVKACMPAIERLRTYADKHDDNAADKHSESVRLAAEAEAAIKKAVSMRDRANRIEKAFS